MPTLDYAKPLSRADAGSAGRLWWSEASAPSWLSCRQPSFSSCTWRFAAPMSTRSTSSPPKWLAASVPDGTYNSVRLRMADSFLADERPIGKSREQIVSLLGEPNDTPYFAECDMVYYLGPERGPMGIDSEWLVLKLKD